VDISLSARSVRDIACRNTTDSHSGCVRHDKRLTLYNRLPGRVQYGTLCRTDNSVLKHVGEINSNRHGFAFRV
jgi:hypothetical protein